MDLDHIVLNVADVDVAIGFYGSIIGLSVERLDEFRAGSVPFPSVRINPTTLIDLFPPKMWDDGSAASTRKPNLNHFCLALDASGWNLLRERLEQGRIPIYRDRTVNFGARGDGISMYFRDPDGNEIEARYYQNY
jgi:glyoxylase I family protein